MLKISGLSPAATRIGSQFRMAVRWRLSIRIGNFQPVANIWTNIICAWGMMFLHICQLAEMLERGGGTCRPEPLITEERSAWDLGSKGFLAIQTCEDGYDYTLYHKDFTEIDGGQIDNSEISMNAARDQILSDYGFGGRTMTRIDYDELCDRAEEAEISRRESVLGKLSDLSSRTDTPVKAAKAKEAER